MQVNRSASVPRNVMAAYDNPILQGYDYTKDSQPKMMHRRESSMNNLDPRNISMNAGREVMRSSVQLDSQQDRGVSASMVLPTDVTRREVESRSRRQGSWGEFLVRQSEVAKRVEHNEKAEDKVRTLKYKEVLDNMMQQEKQKKMAMVKEAREEMVDPQQLQAYSKLEKNRAQEEKRQYYSDLQRLINQKETMKQKEHQKKAEELQEFRQMMNHMQTYESRVNEQERMNKKQIFNDYQNAVNQKHQSYAEQKRREEEEAMREKEGQFFYRQDQERTQLYNKIKNQVNRDMGTQLAEIAHEKRRQVDSFVNRAVQQKEERDAMEMMRRQELLKKRQMDAFENNKMIAAEKMMKNRKDREYREEEGAFISGHARLTDEIERIKKEQESSQKREYLEFLKGQANARQEAKYRDDMMNMVENHVNRVSPDSPTSAYPFNGRSHERSLQLRYIDKWLTNGSHVKK